MSAQTIDSMRDAGPWSVHAPDGTASKLLSTSVVSTRLPDGILMGSRLQLQAQGKATGHYVERSLGPLDLTTFNELRLWIKSPRTADGTARAPFYLRMRLASGTVGFDAQANTWERMIPVAQADLWQLVRLNIADLAGAIRSAANAIRLEVVDAAPFTCVFDALLAVNERVLPDVEAALIASLDQQVTLKNTKVPAVLYLDTGNLPPAPNIRVSPALIEYAPELSVPLEIRTDFTSTSYSLRPPSRGYQLYYDIEADGTDSTDRALLLDFVLDRLMTTASLNVNGEYLPVDVVAVPIPAVAPPVRLPLRLRIRAWKSMPAPLIAVTPVRQVDLQTEGAQR